MKYPILSLVLVSFVMLGCGQNKPSKPYEATAIFTEEFKFLKNINLAKELGDSFHIEKNGNIRKFAVSYDSKSKENEILEIGKGIHIIGTASKYKNLIFINTKLDNGYKITALNIDKKSIQGFADIDKQQELLEKRIIKGLNANLITSHDENGYLLKPDKKELAVLYATILLELPTWQLTK